MISRLYPRIRPSLAADGFRGLHGKTVEELGRAARADLDEVVFAPTGGTRITAGELEALRARVLQFAEESGYPQPARLGQRNRFDRALGVELHARSGMTTGEASVGAVWAYLAIVLLPDVCVWRFPPKSDGTLTDDRFKAGDLTRHTLARTWTRAHVLRDPALADPYELLTEMSEADLDQIMARRRSVAGTPALVRSVVRCFRDDKELPEGVPDRLVLRDSLARLLRMTAFLHLEWYSQDELDELVLKCRAASKVALSEQQ